MTTFVICDSCGEKFKSPIQVSNLETTPVEGNRVNCPHCGQTTLAENRNMINN